jgi:glucose-1-phosphatase
LCSDLKPVPDIFFMLQIQKSEIKNIIFDLGGVLLNINPLLSLLELEKLSGFNQEELLLKLAGAKIFEKFDTGSLNPAQFRDELCRILNHEVSDHEIDRVWNKLLQDFPFPRVELLKQIKRNYRIYLLSNTNIIHFRHWSLKFFEKYGFQMTDLFDQLFLSHEIGIHKPDDGIYLHVLQTAGLVPAETLFFDDSLANIEAAERLGITGIHIRDGHEVTEYFENGVLRENS